MRVIPVPEKIFKSAREKFGHLGELKITGQISPAGEWTHDWVPYSDVLPEYYNTILDSGGWLECDEYIVRAWHDGKPHAFHLCCNFRLFKDRIDPIDHLMAEAIGDYASFIDVSAYERNVGWREIEFGFWKECSKDEFFDDNYFSESLDVF